MLYRCVICGNEVEREDSCCCTNCGHIMYPVPFDRKQILAKEINNLVGELTSIDVWNELRVSRKKNDNRLIPIDGITSGKEDSFPGIEAMQDYICNAVTTDVMLERINQTLREVKAYFHQEHAQDFIVSYENLVSQLELRDETLREALRVLGIVYQPSATRFPEAVLHYRKSLAEGLIQRGDRLHTLLEELARKIQSTIAENDLYGMSHWQNCKVQIDKTSEVNMETLGQAMEDIQRILDTPYRMDFFSSGEDEIREMMSALWTGLHHLIVFPFRENKYLFEDSNERQYTGTDFVQHIDRLIEQRFASIHRPVLEEEQIMDLDEDSLFALYSRIMGVDPERSTGNGRTGTDAGRFEKKLNELIGLSEVKRAVKKIKAYALANKGEKNLNLHMCFYGNPGTGKTEVARIIAGILNENGILPKNKVVEVDRSGLVGEYIGETAIKTSKKIQEAMGGVLFVDEAYALIPKDQWGGDFGYEAVSTLLKGMEDHRGDFCVILAGYQNEMQKMLASNPGLESRIQFKLYFPNYNRNEMQQIARLMLGNLDYIIEENALERLLDIVDIKRKTSNFANARELRNIVDQVIMCQNVRMMENNDHVIGLIDVQTYAKDSSISLPVSGAGMSGKILTGEEELNQLVGLSSVKQTIRKIRAYAKKNKEDENFNLHMCFFGNPGTGKTEVARILSRILYDAGVLREAKIVETDASGLMGTSLGDARERTKEKIDEANGGVLFIDEAYGLSSSVAGSIVIEILLKKMEDRRGQFCVILAGYRDEMQEMLNVNPGFESRIQFVLDFPDYSREEFRDMAKLFLRKKRYDIEEEALEQVLDMLDRQRREHNFANGRVLRNILDQVIMNQNLRTEDEDENRMILVRDVEAYKEDNESVTGSKRKYGF